jgi:hypothetical protein
MSVLRNRIVHHAGVGRGDPAGHPAVTTDTPMTMPMMHVSYGDDEVALYGTLHPLITADGAVIPAHSGSYTARPVPAPVVPAGRP